MEFCQRTPGSVFKLRYDLSTPQVLQWSCNRPSTRETSSGLKSVLRLVEMFMKSKTGACDYA